MNQLNDMLKIPQISKDYGLETVRKIRKLEKLSKQKGRQNSHIHFNLQCKHTGITPKTVKINYKCSSKEVKDIVRRAEKAILNTRIAENYKKKAET